MVNLAVRKNDECVVQHPECGYVFNSSRSCFIGYGFSTSPLEVEILSNVLERLDVEPIEAGSSVQPASNAFCKKICSKIITSRFCAFFVNSDFKNGEYVQNANVNMEYGLALGFQKYVIPFQKQNDTLPFNISGLDTIRYDDRNFRKIAEEAIEKALIDTEVRNVGIDEGDSNYALFLIGMKKLLVSVNTEGDRNLFDIGKPYGFNMLSDYSGMNYVFCGNFSNLSVTDSIWRATSVNEILQARSGTLSERVNLGLVNQFQVPQIQRFVDGIEIWIICNSSQEKEVLLQWIGSQGSERVFRAFDINDVVEIAESVPMGR